MTCTTCGAAVADPHTHELWHAALADIWDWIGRVSGSSCQTAREVLDEETPEQLAARLTERLRERDDPADIYGPPPQDGA